MQQREEKRPRRVLVTGAAKRIGRAIAIHLAESGFSVALHYNTSRKEAEQTARDCKGAPIFQADLTDVPSIRRMFQQVREQFGLIDCLVNNAARFTRIDPLEISEADWDFINNVNLQPAFFWCREGARKRMEPAGGGAVTISPRGGIRRGPNMFT